jgi:RNA polymerase sigma-70 factor (ECF subfamily)
VRAGERGIDEAVRMTDEELVARLRAGDREAMAAVFDQYADRVYNACFRRTASWSMAEDAMAATFLEVWRIRDRATAYDGDLLPWLCAVANNVCRNTMRSARRQSLLRAKLTVVEGIAGHDPSDDVAGRVDDERRMARVLDAMDGWSRADREVLMLVAWDGLSYAQAAAALGVAVGTVRSRVSRSRTRLAGLMEEES